MGFFDFFRKKKEVLELKKVKLDEVTGILLKKKQEINASEIELVELINNIVRLLVTEFESELVAISQVNLNNRKAETKLKLVVKNNLDEFVICLNKLKASLENLQDKKIQDLIKKINLNFQEFKSRSHMNFEKATFLVGDELGAVMESIKGFHEDLNNLLESNKEFTSNFAIVERLEILLNELAQIEKIKKEIGCEINKSGEKASELEKEVESLRKKIEILIKTPKYHAEVEKRQALEAKKENLRGKIADLNKVIDIKELAKIYHSDEKEMKVINEYRENFNEAFENDKGESLIELVNEKDKIQEEISNIIREQKEISEFAIESDEVLEIEHDIGKINNKISELKVEKLKDEKKISQFNEKMKNIKEVLGKELLKINFELV